MAFFKKVLIGIGLLLFSVLLFATNQTDSLFACLKKGDNKAQTLNALSSAYFDSLQDTSLYFSRQAIIQSKIEKNELEKAIANYNIGEYFYYHNNNDSALYYYKVARNIYKKIKNHTKTADCDIVIGIEYEIFGNYSNAIKFYKEASGLYNMDMNKEGESYAYNNLGLIYANYADYKKAIVAFQKSLKIDESLGNKKGVAYSYNNLGLVYVKMNLLKEALKYYKKSLDIKTVLNDTKGIALTSINIGSAYEKLGDIEKAKEYYNLSLKNSQAVNDVEDEAYALNNLGSINEESDNFVLAETYYQKALLLRKKIGDKKGIVFSLTNLANLHLKQQHYQKALQFYKRSNPIARQLDLREEIKENYLGLSGVYAGLGNYKKALSYFQLFSSLKDSILNAETNKQISELNIKYETEKKEFQIKKQNVELSSLQKEKQLQLLTIEKEKEQKISLVIFSLLIITIAAILLFFYKTKAKTNKILEVKNEELKQINALKNKFFSIFSHDIKNPFGTLVSVADYLYEDFQKLNETEKLDIIKTIRNSSELTYKLLENLLLWSQTQTNRVSYQPELNSIGSVIKENIELLKINSENKHINILYNPDNQAAYFDKETIQTVIRNLLSNAIKFSSENSTIIIQVDTNEEQLKVSIIDQGIGLSENDIQLLFRIDVDNNKIGNSKEKGTGLGLIICKEFVELNKGNIFVESKLGEGSTFNILLPKRPV